LWFDVEDLFEYVRTNHRRPTGIQRLAFEIYREVQARYGDTGLVHFVRHSLSGTSFQVVRWSEVATLFAGLTTSDTAPIAHTVDGSMVPRLPARQLIRRLAYRMSPALRAHVVDALVTQGKALRSWGRLISLLQREAVRLPPKLWQRLNKPKAHDAPSSLVSESNFADLAAPGDILLMLGATWSHPDYAGLIHKQCKANGLRFAMLVYDLIPLRRPEWCTRLFVRDFRKWIDRILPLCNVVFAISRATASDVEAYATQQGIALPGAVVTLPIGSELRQSPGLRSTRLPPLRSYALMVSTIEARKNHVLLFRVWRRMLEELPSERVPTLVFAGRVGWLIDDLMQQITNTDNLGGKLILVESPSDAELAALYDGCLFTLFPSFYEGWGLPVTESLGFGKPCLIANRTSLPEAGGDLVRSFDPDNLHDAYAVIRGVVEDRAGLAQWEARVRREFRPVPWSATVDALLVRLGVPLAKPLLLDIIPSDVAHSPPARIRAIEEFDIKGA
jgi:glycosyltransferase involved in cell wall biosynthesis